MRPHHQKTAESIEKNNAEQGMMINCLRLELEEVLLKARRLKQEMKELLELVESRIEYF